VKSLSREVPEAFDVRQLVNGQAADGSDEEA
jgi:hypothetical protein